MGNPLPPISRTSFALNARTGFFEADDPLISPRGSFRSAMFRCVLSILFMEVVTFAELL